MASVTSERKVALITGITGQDGSYLSELLLQKGYEVHGLVRRNTAEEGSNYQNISHIQSELTIHYGDITDMSCLIQILKSSRPTEVYNLAGQSHVSLSFTVPEYTFKVNQGGLLNMLQAIVHCNMQSAVRLYQASTSELFGGSATAPLDEESPFAPQSPYAISKLSSHWLIDHYRKLHSMFAVCGIAFNHESPRRSRRFVTQRIACGVAAYMSTGKPLTLANVDSTRDWGHARDYVLAMWLMLQQNSPSDFVLATGVSHSVRDFLDAAFRHLGIDLIWQESELGLQAIDPRNLAVVLTLDRRLSRPTEVHHLLGNSRKAKEVMKWEPRVQFKDLVVEMVDEAICRARQLDASATKST